MRFGDETECYSAMTEMQGMMLGSRALRLSQATPKKSSSMGGGMGMPMGMPMGMQQTGTSPSRTLRVCVRCAAAEFHLENECRDADVSHVAHVADGHDAQPDGCPAHGDGDAAHPEPRFAQPRSAAQLPSATAVLTEGGACRQAA